MTRIAAAAFLVFTLFVGVAGALGAEGKEPAFGKEFGKALPPIGFVKFCLVNPIECEGQSPAADRISLSTDTWQKLVDINYSVNTAINPVSDQDLYGVPELWTYPTDAGDCEDYLLLKKRTLERMGFPRSALLITVVLDEKEEGHAVLTVVTDKGDFVLDNRRTEILIWNKTGYKFLKRQSAMDAKLWMALTKQSSDPGQLIATGEHRE